MNRQEVVAKLLEAYKYEREQGFTGEPADRAMHLDMAFGLDMMTDKILWGGNREYCEGYIRNQLEGRGVIEFLADNSVEADNMRKGFIAAGAVIAQWEE